MNILLDFLPPTKNIGKFLTSDYPVNKFLTMLQSPIITTKKKEKQRNKIFHQGLQNKSSHMGRKKKKQIVTPKIST